MARGKIAFTWFISLPVYNLFDVSIEALSVQLHLSSSALAFLASSSVAGIGSQRVKIIT
jgi:hypothetical protein